MAANVIVTEKGFEPSKTAIAIHMLHDTTGTKVLSSVGLKAQHAQISTLKFANFPGGDNAPTSILGRGCSAPPQTLPTKPPL